MGLLKVSAQPGCRPKAEIRGTPHRLRFPGSGGLGRVTESIARTMAEGAAQMTGNEHHCHASGLSEADKNFCLGISKT